jgi:hypothetical protein
VLAARPTAELTIDGECRVVLAMTGSVVSQC